MSKHNNVNPDHYKLAGREHPGDGIHHERNKREMKMEEKALEQQKAKAAAPRRPRRETKGSDKVPSRTAAPSSTKPR